jgi:hypothetical protein
MVQLRGISFSRTETLRKFRDQSGAPLAQQITSYYYQGYARQMTECNFEWFGLLLFRNEIADSGNGCHVT